MNSEAEDFTVNRRTISTVGRSRAGAQHPWWVAYPSPALSMEPARGSADAPAAYPPYGYGHGRVDGEVDVGRVSAAHPAHYRQRGAVLAVSLIFLLLLSIVAISLMRSGQLEVLMAGNAQSRLGAFELAEGVADSVLARWEDNLDTEEIVCSNGHPDPDGDCDRTDLAWDPRLDPDSGDPDLLPQVENATITGRARPLNDGQPGCVPSFITGIAHGTWAFFFDVEATFDNTEVRQGASQVNRGAVLVNPVSADCYSNPQNIGNLDKFAHNKWSP